MKILQDGHPHLKERLATVHVNEFSLKQINSYAEVMNQLMQDNNGVGLASNQIGSSLRFFIMKHDLGYEILINPKIIFSTGKSVSNEGCLSFMEPNMRRIKVKRKRLVTVRFIDGKGRDREETYEGFKATVVQHEIDHLDGITMDVRSIQQRKPTNYFR
jgi:peptide deformylase